MAVVVVLLLGVLFAEGVLCGCLGGGGLAVQLPPLVGGVVSEGAGGPCGVVSGGGWEDIHETVMAHIFSLMDLITVCLVMYGMC